MSTNQKKRLISGERVICRCSLMLPRLNPFAPVKTSRNGIVVINVRGCSLYLPQQLTEESIKDVFPPDSSALIKKFCLYTKDNSVIELGDLKARFMHFRHGRTLTAMVLRFVNLSEEQLDTLNQLDTVFPPVASDEESSVPLAVLNKI